MLLGSEESVRKPDNARRRKGVTVEDVESSLYELVQG